MLDLAVLVEKSIKNWKEVVAANGEAIVFELLPHSLFVFPLHSHQPTELRVIICHRSNLWVIDLRRPYLENHFVINRLLDVMQVLIGEYLHLVSVTHL